jgi:hypothetical protein
VFGVSFFVCFRTVISCWFNHGWGLKYNHFANVHFNTYISVFWQPCVYDLLNYSGLSFVFQSKLSLLRLCMTI